MDVVWLRRWCGQFVLDGLNWRLVEVIVGGLLVAESDG
jgi:hypothetical protein